MTKAKCVILGAGGHAAVVIDAILKQGELVPHAVLDRDESKWKRSLLGIPIRGGDDLLSKLVQEGVRSFVVGLGSVGDVQPRVALYQLGISHHLQPATVVHPSAIVGASVEVGAGAQLFAGSIVNPRVRIGVNAIINTGAIVEHDCIIGDHAHIATGAQLASSVTVKRGAHVGAGATVRQLITIGEDALIGAGAAVIHDVPAGAVVAGVPAKPIERNKT